MDERNIPLWGEDPHVLWSSYLRYARCTGVPRKHDDGEERQAASSLSGVMQQAYSFWWLFAKYSLEDFAGARLARAFLGDVDAWRSLQEDCAREAAALRCDVTDFLGLPPNKEQWRAIDAALKSPISFIQGPPGTGKTATILNLVYQIAKQDVQKTVAIVSSNNAALANIHAALDTLAEKAGAGERHKADGLRRRLARLGNSKNRDDFYTECHLTHKSKPVYFVQDGENAPIHLEGEDWPMAEMDGLKRAIAAQAEREPADEAAAEWLEALDALGEPTSLTKAAKLHRLLLQGWAMAHPTGAFQKVNWENTYTARDFFQLVPPGQEGQGEDGFPHSGFAAFTSTVNSLPVCFQDGLDGSFFQYDYIIIDETSQMGLVPGLVAMFHAKHLVLVGDEQQLAPVVDEKILSQLRFEEEDVADEGQVHEPERAAVQGSEASRWSHYYPDSDKSFLDLCLDVFLGEMEDGKRQGGLVQGAIPKVFLSKHYRCHPAIIRFCDEMIYRPVGTPLEILTPCGGEEEFPIKVLTFDGDYCERCYRGKEIGVPPEGRRPGGTSKHNRKQVEIFIEEELPQLLLRLHGDEPPSVCILSPFHGQLTALKEAILAVDSTIRVEEAKTDDLTLSALTIHKSQGQEFDVVYLLPVEDGAWEWPFSQKKRMVNVAVSRARKELRVIASTKFMTMTPKKRGGDHGNGSSTDEGGLYVKRLIQYVKDNVTPEARAQGFGDQPTCLVSLFDVNEVDPDKKKCCTDSFAQQHVDAFLQEALPQLGIPWTGERKRDREVPVKSVLQELLGDGLQEDGRFRPFWGYISRNARFDCVIREPRTGRPILAIEVDGPCHRFPWAPADGGEPNLDEAFENWRVRFGHDRDKDDIVRALGGAVYYGNRKPCRAKLAPGPFALLRLANDGSTFLETDALREAVRGRGAVGKQVADKVFTIQDLIRKLLAGEKDA